MRIVFRQSALADIESIHRFISRDNSFAARSVVTRIRDSVRRLDMFPFSGRRGGVEGTYEIVVPKLPYIVVYTVGPEAVEIVAVFHAAQDRERGPP